MAKKEKYESNKKKYLKAKYEKEQLPPPKVGEVSETKILPPAPPPQQPTLFVRKTFGKIKTTADMLIEKKQREQAKVVLVKAQAQQNQPSKNEQITETFFHPTKPTFGKVVTTVEVLLKDKHQQQIDFKFNNNEGYEETVTKPIVKAKSRTEWLKAIEQAPAGAIKVGLKNVNSNNHEQTLQRVNFNQMPKQGITKKSKKDLAVEETKELQLTIHDILDKSKK
ncbi:hypothetical protein [Spiroplasma endosymbiont of Polydrusus cervinus]|uniref:hypothetical protein n=1 Tax=Spiroplasma endosymbiont of Polydrusus cervinus TaxID=3066287 RepID=UPI0030CBAB93